MAILHNPHVRLVLGVVFATLLVFGMLYLLRNHLPFPFIGQGVVVNEALILPETTEVGRHAGRVVVSGAYRAPINPTPTTRVISSRAIYSLKEAHQLVEERARAWAPDAALVSIQSLGVITEEGRSGEWQLFFASKARGTGIEFIVYEDAIAREKEVASAGSGFALPSDWYDSGEALRSLRGMPQFEKATVSSLNFFYNEDGERWGYVLATSLGTVSIPVR